MNKIAWLVVLLTGMVMMGQEQKKQPAQQQTKIPPPLPGQVCWVATGYGTQSLPNKNGTCPAGDKAMISGGTNPKIIYCLNVNKKMAVPCGTNQASPKK